ncbi:hypothetical protein HDU76_012628 [Blyttiomyces sp. JEL0837]|nr:hypothetical protein HDU76_012628 [Blyttiomyces sp. JEL0837]
MAICMVPAVELVWYNQYYWSNFSQDYFLHYFEYDKEMWGNKSVVRDVDEVVIVGNDGGSDNSPKLSISVRSLPEYHLENWKDLQLEMIVYANTREYRRIDFTAYFNSNSGYEFVAPELPRGKTYFYPTLSSISTCPIDIPLNRYPSTTKSCQLTLPSNSISTITQPGLLLLSPVTTTSDPF